MTYATADDMLARFGETELVNATDREGTGLIDAVRIGVALTAADNEIEAAIASKYSLPLASIPSRLVDLACDIARYKMYPLEAPQLVRDRYSDAKAALLRIARGDETLVISGGAPTATATDAVQFVTSERRMTRETMRDL